MSMQQPRDDDAEASAATEQWIAEQIARAPKLTEEQRAALAPLLDCTGPTLTGRRS